jgi:hypothetical protein
VEEEEGEEVGEEDMSDLKPKHVDVIRVIELIDEIANGSFATKFIICMTALTKFFSESDGEFDVFLDGLGDELKKKVLHTRKFISEMRKKE